MTKYIFKRILLMFPTLFFISVIIFVVLNLAPGRPGGAQISGEGMQDSTSAEARESYRIFKEQFNFDKPALLNFRFGLEKEDALVHILNLADFRRPTCSEAGEPAGCIEADAKPPSSAIIEAQDNLEDWGEYVVPELLELAESHERLDVRRIALSQLSVNSKRRLINEYDKKQTPEERALNREIAAENERIGQWKVGPEGTAEEVDQIVTQKWAPWFEERRARFEYEGAEVLEVLFLDTRFAKYWANLIRFDFGVSHVDKRPVMDKIAEKVPYTLTINFLAILIAYFFSIPIGVWSAYRQNTTADRIVTAILFALYSLPSFFVGVLLIELLADGDPFGIFPTGGFVGSFPDWYDPGETIQSVDEMTVAEEMLSVAYHIALPVFCLTYGAIASLSRYARTGLLDVIRADYIRTARAKGLGEPMVIVKHAVRNGMIPVLTLLGTMLPALIGGSVVIEYVFNVPGMGLFMFESIFARDYNSMMGVLLISTVLTLIGLLISDISYAIVDPRISFD